MQSDTEMHWQKVESHVEVRVVSWKQLYFLTSGAGDIASYLTPAKAGVQVLSGSNEPGPLDSGRRPNDHLGQRHEGQTHGGLGWDRRYLLQVYTD